MIRETVDRIRNSLQRGQYTNEAAISLGVVLPLLQALDWPVFDTSVVTPEYTVGNGRVDFALRETTGRPKISVEVKRAGQIENADRQLFEYAFHQGVPMAVLTDGREWSFYLPLEEGQYDERRVYKLNLFERPPTESTYRLQRYLDYNGVTSGDALSYARKDYKTKERERLIDDTIPKAWQQLLSDPDELLVELLADKVEDICGFKPGPDKCSEFVQTKSDSRLTTSETDDREEGTTQNGSQQTQDMGFSYRGNFHTSNSAREVIQKVLITFAAEDSEFLARFAARGGTKKRNFIAKSQRELYPGRPDLAKYSVELARGWWMGTNYSKSAFTRKARLACQVANVEFGKDLKLSL